MSAPCSLEHCHTNLFALQSLNDMKWKCFRRSLNYRLEPNHYKDPVLIAYWNALRADTLCAWRRVLADDGQKTEKELWLFGINEDLPSELPNLRPMNQANGSWNENALSYDCRSMLFKALHNMIEKYLLSKGFARLNKWFVLPINDHSDVKVPNFSFNFTFFLHGDNKVCASVDVQRHRYIYNLTSKDLDKTSPSNVILAPYGISGMLTGPVSRDIDLNLLRENWERNYSVRHIDGLPDFVEVTVGNIRMFYPTCYVYKIASNNDATTSSNETTPPTKKADLSSMKKSKIPTSSTPTTLPPPPPSTAAMNSPLDLLSNNNKNESMLIKNLANQLLISAQRNNCIDIEKKQDTKCLSISDPMNRRICRCHQCLTSTNRLSAFIPFHRRPSTTPPVLSDPSSIRTKVEPIKTENPIETNENTNTLIQKDALVSQSTSSPAVNNPIASNQQTTNENKNEWTASTPNSVSISGPPSVLAPITNLNSVQTNSPVPASTTSRGLKRSATMAFDDLSIVEDDEREQHKQTYDFNRTDNFLQLPLKRFRTDTNSIINSMQSSLTINNSSSSSSLITTDHLYRHGQPTPPSPSHLLSRTDPYEFGDDEDAISRLNYPPSTPTSNIRQNQTSFNTMDGPSITDLDTIIDSHDTNENKNMNSNVLSHILSNGGVKSPLRKENSLIYPILAASHPLSTTNGNTFPVNKSLNGVFHELEQIYNTPPGSSSSEKLQALHSPYAIMVDSVSSAANTFDMLNQFSQESIIAPFESITVEDHSSYRPLKKSLHAKLIKRYEPSKLFSISISTHHKPIKHWKRTLTTTDYSSSPFNNQQILRQQQTPRSSDIRNTSMSISNVPTPTMYSPMNNNPSIRSTDLQSSPFPIRSVGSVQALNSPTTYSQSITINQPEVDSLLFNVLLNDSILNFFRDMNFDSCVLCACTPNELSIRGIDSTIYLEKPRDFLKPSATPTSAGAQNQPTHSPFHPHMYPHQQSSYHMHPHSSLYAQPQQQQQQQQHHAIPSTNSHSHHNSCSCGFSAVVNLRLSYSSGLFYEDEIEITGIKADLKYRTSTDHLPVNLLELIERKECLPSPFDYFINKNIQTSISTRKNDQDITQILKQPVYQYENLACRAAIEQSRNVVNNLMTDDLDKHHWLHQWSYLTSPLDSDQQLITMLRSLQPLLVDALKKRNVNGLWSTIDGPLTWKSFHQLLYVQNQHVQLEEQISGPQPIPYLLAGLDREGVMLAPYSLKFWDKLCLEPYSKNKDIAYVCVVPDNDYVCSMTKTYFRELSTHYELCRLGLHRPLLKAFSDQGLLRIPQTNNDSTQLPNVDQWFTDHETSHSLGTRLKLYAQTIKGQLFNLLSTQPFDNTLLEEGTSRRDIFRTPNDVSNSSSSLDLHSSNNDLTNSGYALSPSSTSSIAPTSSLIANTIYTTGSTATDVLSLSSNNMSSLANGTFVNGHQVDPVDLQAFESFHQGRTSNDEQFFIVIYLIDTFRYEITASMTDENGNNNTSIDDRIDAYVKKAIFRAYMDLIKDLPEKISIRVNIQIIPFESIVNQQVESDSELRLTQLKRLAFNVYGQLKRTVSYTTRAKSLTGFGPAASEEKMPAKIVMQLYTPAYILSPKADFRFKAFADITEQTNINGSILFCSYCLSDDQRYLLATCSDDRGELLETCSIDIEVPDRHRRKVQHARRIGLQKLWDFIMRVVTSTTMPWRIVIGRLGRLGHGELKSWGIILSKKNLVRCATLIRDSCPMCHILRCHDQPVILSACLISMETHPSLAVLPESLELGEIRGTQAPNNNATTMTNGGQVLDDISVTHILTLPTSASVQHVQTMPRPNDHRSTVDNEDDLFSKLFEDLDPEGPPNEAFDNITSPTPVDLEFSSNYADMNHHGNTHGLASGQHHRLGSSSNAHNDYHGNHPYGTSSNGTNLKSNSFQHFEYEIDMNDHPSLHQQPLALGFYVSTIGTLNPLPLWMLHGKLNQRATNACSVFKATLHVSVPNAQHSDDMLFAQSNDQKLTHPLDSNYTYVVLRYVLESYNRLSWLLIDAKTNERASCLPIHIETLLRLYHAFIKFV
ncbi:unnamed protein product [Rotaria magnacalcarata]|uniref:Mediator of RNA polymerase II transcription subunit 13 n=15 Tax=Rotaria magnacalcarata TaxID=392030 RepID=A0A814M4P9_9BILA|nr:unnamed protein product [Rotaria magnacalcarata]CAF1521684.1 unnamed protein product [Rotaria magnacalcarata]